MLENDANMATEDSGLTISLESGHGSISPLPILDRLEAEIAANLLAQLATQQGPSQDIPCGQLMRASPVHDPASDGFVDPVAKGDDSSPPRRSSSEFSQSLISEPIPRSSTAEKPARGRKTVNNPRKTVKTPKQPRETAARKTEQIRAQVEQNQAKLDSMSSSVDKIHASLTLVTSQLNTIAQQQAQSAKSALQQTQNDHRARSSSSSKSRSHSSREHSANNKHSSDNKLSSDRHAKSKEHARSAGAHDSKNKPRDVSTSLSQSQDASAGDSAQNAKTASGHSSATKFPRKSSEKASATNDLPKPTTRESRLDVFNRALKAAKEREAAEKAAAAAKRVLNAREVFQPSQLEHGPDLISRDPRLQARRHPAQHYIRTAEDTREYVERTLGISTRIPQRTQSMPRAAAEHDKQPMSQQDANKQALVPKHKQSDRPANDLPPPPPPPRPSVGSSAGASTSTMKGYGRSRSTSGWRPDLPVPKPARLQHAYIDPRSGRT